MRSPRFPLRAASVALSVFVLLGVNVQAIAAEGTPAAPREVPAAISESTKKSSAKDPSPATPPGKVATPTTPLGTQIEDLKKASLELNRDLSILEEDLLFPASTQIAVFLSLDVGQYFNLDSVKLTIDDQLIASHLYTPKQSHALVRGGIQRLYLGNLKTGKHEITAFFIGKGPDERDYKRGATYNFTKDQKPGMLEIRIMDATRNMQPTFEFKEWRL